MGVGSRIGRIALAASAMTTVVAGAGPVAAAEDPPAPAGMVSFASAAAAVAEVGPLATITVQRTGGSAGAASVEVALAPGGTAGLTNDYGFDSPHTVSWADGEDGPRAVTVNISHDAVDEADETVLFTLQNPATVAIGTPSAATLTIVDDDTGAPPDGPNPPPDPDEHLVRRLAGADRIATAIAASQEAWPTGGAGTVVLARSDGFADALVGVPLAAAGNGPLLLTPPTILDGRVLTEIQRVLAVGGTVHLLGGPAALDVSIDDAIGEAGFVVARHGGADRFATALAVAAALGSPRQVFLATGRNFPDALTAGAAAAARRGVVLLSDDAHLSDPVREYLADTNDVVAVGGPAARALPRAVPFVGQTRYDTAALLAREIFQNFDAIGVATGENFPDALSGGAHIAHHGGPLLLTPGAALDPGVTVLLVGRGAGSIVYLYGGTAVLSAEVEAALRR